MKQRILGLDILRILAIFLVLGRHMMLPPESWPKIWRHPFVLWQRGGWIGVDLFFVLSGFLVSGLIFKEYQSRKCISIGRFYVRRGWKIYPPFFVLLLVTVLVKILLGRFIAIESLFSEIFFLQSYVPGLWEYTWSLAVEEHFYLILPILLICIIRLPNNTDQSPFRQIVMVAFFVAILCLFLRVLNWNIRSTYSHLTHVYASHLRMDSLFWGVVISYFYHFHRLPFLKYVPPWRYGLFFVALCLFMPAFFMDLETSWFINTIGFTLFYIASGMLLLTIILCPLKHHPITNFLATLGAHSYSIYLWHMPVLKWIIPIVEKKLGSFSSFPLLILTYVIGSLTIGVVMSKLIEIPSLRLREHYFSQAR